MPAIERLIHEPDVTMVDAGPMESWRDHKLILGPAVEEGKLFLAERLDLRNMDFSINSTAPGEGSKVCHSHKKQEEVYIFLSGSGQMRIGDRVVDVRAGNMVRLAPPVKRALRNNGNENLVWICLRASEGAFSTDFRIDPKLEEGPVEWPD